MAGEIVLEALRRALAALRKLGRDPVLVGGLGLQAWGRIRQTKDVDLLIPAAEAERERCFRAAEAEGLARDPSKPVLQIAGTSVLRLLYTDPKFGIPIRVDLIEASGGFLSEVVRRATRVRVSGEDLRLATCEDLILMKLLAGRAIDRADAADLLRIHGDLDRPYLEATARRLGLESDLARCEAESRGDS